VPRMSLSGGMGKRSLACGVAAVLLCAAALWPALSAETAQIPNFAPDSITGWLKPPGDEFIPPESGPGPVRSDPTHPYVSNAVARQERAEAAHRQCGLRGPVPEGERLHRRIRIGGDGDVVRAPRVPRDVVSARERRPSRLRLQVIDTEVRLAGARQSPRGRKPGDSSPENRRADSLRSDGRAREEVGAPEPVAKRLVRHDEASVEPERPVVPSPAGGEGGSERRRGSGSHQRDDRVAPRQSNFFHSLSYVRTRTWSFSRFTGASTRAMSGPKAKSEAIVSDERARSPVGTLAGTSNGAGEART
jgi:hypothetical protein